MSAVTNILLTGLLLTASLTHIPGNALADDNIWYFTADEIEIAYRYQQNFGRRLHHPLKARDCYFGKADFIASFQGKEFLAPCQFILQTTGHLKTILEIGAAKYLFPLDSDHAHLAITTDLWREKYNQTNGPEILPEILREPTLVALYHTAEHLSAVDRESSPMSLQVENWKAQRNILASYDSRPLKILPPHPDGSAHERVEGHQTVVTLFFLAHPLAELIVSASGRSHSFDLSFDDDLAEQSLGATTGMGQ